MDPVLPNRLPVCCVVPPKRPPPVLGVVVAPKAEVPKALPVCPNGVGCVDPKVPPVPNPVVVPNGFWFPNIVTMRSCLLYVYGPELYGVLTSIVRSVPRNFIVTHAHNSMSPWTARLSKLPNARCETSTG